jgi:ArsR family transcriptional regulator, arsenate/arsenite/antimonite-responsive transcriptional repressor
MDPDQFHRISKALADPRRMEILESVAAEGEVACSALCEESAVSQATMSHHLRELVNSGLLKTRREAKFVFYRFQDHAWAEYLAEIRRRVPLRGRRKG